MTEFVDDEPRFIWQWWICDECLLLETETSSVEFSRHGFHGDVSELTPLYPSTSHCQIMGARCWLWYGQLARKEKVVLSSENCICSWIFNNYLLYPVNKKKFFKKWWEVYTCWVRDNAASSDRHTQNQIIIRDRFFSAYTLWKPVTTAVRCT